MQVVCRGFVGFVSNVGQHLCHKAEGVLQQEPECIGDRLRSVAKRFGDAFQHRISKPSCLEIMEEFRITVFLVVMHIGIG